MRKEMIAALALGATLAAPTAWPQNAAVAGTYKVVSNVNITADGKRTDTFGANPHGMMILGADGYFAIVNARSDLPKFASNSRMNGTPEENKAIVQGSISLFGTYTADKDTIVMKVQGTSWPGWLGAEQKRAYKVSGDKLSWTVPAASGGGTAEVVWQKVK